MLQIVNENIAAAEEVDLSLLEILAFSKKPYFGVCCHKLFVAISETCVYSLSEFALTAPLAIAQKKMGGR